MLPVPGVTEVGVVLGHCSDGNHAFTADSHQCGFSLCRFHIVIRGRGNSAAAEKCCGKSGKGRFGKTHPDQVRAPKKPTPPMERRGFAPAILTGGRALWPLSPGEMRES